MIYFDHAATSLPDDSVLQHYFGLVKEFCGNSESSHLAGYRIRKALTGCGERMVELAGLPPDFGVLWFPGTTDVFNFIASTNLVRGRAVYTSTLEHPALTAALRRNARQYHILSADNCGQIVLPENVRENCFAAFFQMQSELGSVTDFRRVEVAFPRAVIMSDSVQAAGKMQLPHEARLIVVSGAKIGAPAGGALLFFDRSCLPLRELPEIFRKYRSTDYFMDRLYAPQLLAMEAAYALKLKQQRQEIQKVAQINSFIRKEAAALGAVETLPPEKASPFICHLNFPGKQGAVIARMFSEAGIMVSSGSACAAEAGGPSPALLAIGFDRDGAYSGLRLSFSNSNTMGEAARFLQILSEILQKY